MQPTVAAAADAAPVLPGRAEIRRMMNSRRHEPHYTRRAAFQDDRHPRAGYVAARVRAERKRRRKAERAARRRNRGAR